jgi:hypothetical protein
MIKIQSENSNYLARLVRLPAPRKHSNADKLNCVSVLGNNVIVSKDSQEGELFVFFPLECSINTEFLAFSNSLDNPELNADKKTKGFFSAKHGRVKALSLRGEKSEGYLCPASKIEEWSGYKFSDSDLDKDFDTICEKIICKKYVVAARTQSQGSGNKKGPKKPRESKIISDQFRFHTNTSQLKKNIENINPEDFVSLSYKIHGTSVVIGKVLCKRKLSLKDRIAKFFGVKVVESEYDLVISSRKVVKNDWRENTASSYYDIDIWNQVGIEIKDSIKDGITIYGEIVGQLSNGKWIQKPYDYGCEENKHKAFVYRITYTSSVGEVFEFTPGQVKRYCEKFGLNRVPEFYYGKAKDWDSSIAVDENWHKNFLTELQKKYNEKDCYMCKNNVPEEGIVLIKESDSYMAYKLKSFLFLKRESEALDSGEENIEESN